MLLPHFVTKMHAKKNSTYQYASFALRTQLDYLCIEILKQFFMLAAHDNLWNNTTASIVFGLKDTIDTDWLVVVEDSFLMSGRLSFPLQPIKSQNFLARVSNL